MRGGRLPASPPSRQFADPATPTTVVRCTDQLPMSLFADRTDFRPLQRYEQIAERLAADIRSGLLAPGERLPSERDLARSLEVSRASVREAIGALQVQGVVETRPG